MTWCTRLVLALLIGVSPATVHAQSQGETYGVRLMSDHTLPAESPVEVRIDARGRAEIRVDERRASAHLLAAAFDVVERAFADTSEAAPFAMRRRMTAEESSPADSTKPQNPRTTGYLRQLTQIVASRRAGDGASAHLTVFRTIGGESIARAQSPKVDTLRRQTVNVAVPRIVSETVQACAARPLSAQLPLRLDSSSVLFVDNPSIAFGDSGVAIAGTQGFRYGLQSKSGRIEVHPTAGARLFGVVRRADGRLRVIAPSSVHDGPSGDPVLRFAADGSLDIVWRSNQTGGPDGRTQLNTGRWQDGAWSGVEPLLRYGIEDLLTQTNTSRPSRVGNDLSSYLKFTRRGRVQSRLLRSVDGQWRTDSVRNVGFSNPALVTLDSDQLLVLALDGLPPHGNTVVASRVRLSGDTDSVLYRVSETTIPVVQKPFGYLYPGGVVALFSGGMNGAEDSFFATVSPDSGRSWTPAVSINTGSEEIKAWDAAHVDAGRAVVLVNVRTPSTVSGTELRMLLFDADAHAWHTLWRANSEAEMFGVPAITASGSRIAIAFNAGSTTVARWPETYLMEFTFSCSAM